MRDKAEGVFQCRRFVEHRLSMDGLSVLTTQVIQTSSWLIRHVEQDIGAVAPFVRGVLPDNNQ